MSFALPSRSVRHARRALAALVLGAAAALPARAVVVFATDFEGPLPAELSPGTASTTPVQGFAGLGTGGNVFAGSFLRSETGNAVTLTLTNLPGHDALSVTFLFAAIDSLDGTGSFPSGDFFRIDIDGVTALRESFANAADAQVQSYVAPPGAELARKVDLGFAGPGGFYRDSAYDFGLDPRFQQFAHSSSTLTLTFLIEGQGIQSLDDESWAMDNLRVDAYLAAAPVPEPQTWALMAAGLAAAGAAARRRRSTAARG